MLSLVRSQLQINPSYIVALLSVTVCFVIALCTSPTYQLNGAESRPRDEFSERTTQSPEPEPASVPIASTPEATLSPVVKMTPHQWHMYYLALAEKLQIAADGVQADAEAKAQAGDLSTFADDGMNVSLLHHARVRALQAAEQAE